MRDQHANSVIKVHHAPLSKRLSAGDLTILLEAYDVLAQLGREDAKNVRLERKQKENKKSSVRNSDGNSENAQ